MLERSYLADYLPASTAECKMQTEQSAREAIETIETLLLELSKVLSREVDYDSWCEMLRRWGERAVRLIAEKVSRSEADKLGSETPDTPIFPKEAAERSRGFLVALAETLRTHPEEVFTVRECERPTVCDALCSSAARPESFEGAVSSVVRICERFHLVAKELKHRRVGREALKMEDEYDVQYLLGALLRLDFDDVRAEEPTPSCAGKSSRIDFFLQGEGLAVEAKNTRDGLTNAQVGTELNDDKGRYRKMAGCRGLVCLVYDPEDLLKNPTAVEKDLSEDEGGFLVKVIVSPRHT